MSKKTAHEILDDEDFKSLMAQKNTLCWVLTILELILYFGFIALIAFNKPFLAKKWTAGGATTIGIPIAILTIVFSWVLTGIYIVWTNAKYDSRVRSIKDKIGV